MTSADLFRVDGKVALVTGASRGLGLVIARTLADAGALVVLAARDGAKLEAAALDIRRSGARAEFEAFDLLDENAVLAAVSRMTARHGAPHILVNNAGTSPNQSLVKSTLDVWDRTHNVNVRSAYILSREVARGMIERRDGRIINITSYTATVGRDRFPAYASSKGALAALTRTMAAELGRHNITVNNISPGLFMTDMADPMKANPSIYAAYRNAIALGRGGEPEEIGGAVLFLASRAGSYVTGATIDVDGGMANATPIHFALQ
jgi:gluconate 5-dehydrogenase